MTGAGAMANMTQMPGMAGTPKHDTSAPGACDHAPETPGDGSPGAASCMLVAHCGTVMVAGDGSVTLAVGTIVAQRAPIADVNPHERTLEPDSPPPRG